MATTNVFHSRLASTLLKNLIPPNVLLHVSHLAKLAPSTAFGHKVPPFQRTTRRPSTCGCPPRIHSGLPHREDHASNLVGLVRDITGLLGWRRPFRAVRQIGQTWATCTPGMLYRASWTPQSRGARSARTSPPQRARAARESEGV